MNLDEEIAELERLLGQRRPRNVRLLREVHDRLELLRNVIAYVEKLRCPDCGRRMYDRADLWSAERNP